MAINKSFLKKNNSMNKRRRKNTIDDCMSTQDLHFVGESMESVNEGDPDPTKTSSMSKIDPMSKFRPPQNDKLVQRTKHALIKNVWTQINTLLNRQDIERKRVASLLETHDDIRGFLEDVLACYVSKFITPPLEE